MKGAVMLLWLLFAAGCLHAARVAPAELGGWLAQVERGYHQERVR